MYTKRAMSLRRAYYVSGKNKKLIADNFKMYRKAEEPAILRRNEETDEQLAQKKVAEEPGVSDRTKMRRQCNPKGPIGYLLETVHLQASAMDDGMRIHQHNQAPHRPVERSIPAHHTDDKECSCQEQDAQS